MAYLCGCRLKQFDSGVLVVQSMVHGEEAVVKETLKMVWSVCVHVRACVRACVCIRICVCCINEVCTLVHYQSVSITHRLKKMAVSLQTSSRDSPTYQSFWLQKGNRCLLCW